MCNCVCKPLSVPYFISCNSNNDGTTTAGLTADKTKPKVIANAQFMDGSNKRMSNVTVNASVKHGINDKRNVVALLARNATISNPNPARTKITVNAVFRKKNDQLEGICCNKKLFLILAIKTPAINIPNNGGNLIYDFFLLSLSATGAVFLLFSNDRCTDGHRRDAISPNKYARLYKSASSKSANTTVCTVHCPDIIAL